MGSMLERQQQANRLAKSFVVRAMKRGPTNSSQVMTGGGRDPLGFLNQSTMAQHQEQYNHNRGYTNAIIRTIAQRVAGQPLVVGRKNDRSGAKKTPGRYKNMVYLESKVPPTLKTLVSHPNASVLQNHPLIDVLNRPNKIMVAYTLWYVTIESLDITGKSYWWMLNKDQTSSGKAEIWPLPASWVEPIHTKDELFAGWKVTPQGASESYTVPGKAIAYFYYPDPSNPMSALSPMQAQGKTVLADEYLEIAQGRSFQNSCSPGLALTVGKLPETAGISGDNRPVLTKEQRNKLINAVKAQYRGILAMDEPLILDGMITDVKKITMTPREMDYLNSSKATKSRLAQGWGVNPISMGEIEGANRASSAVADQHLVDNVCNPRIEFVSQTLTYWVAPFFADEGEELFAYLEKAHSNDDDFNLNLEQSMVDHSAMGINEWRKRRGLTPFKWPDGGDRILIPSGQGQDRFIRVEMEINENIQPDPLDIDSDGIRGHLTDGYEFVKEYMNGYKQKGYKSIAQQIGLDGVVSVWEQHQREQEEHLKRDVHRYLVQLGGHIKNVFAACMSGNAILTPTHVDFIVHESEILDDFKKAVKPKLLDIALAGAAFHWSMNKPVKTFIIDKSIMDWIRELPTRVTNKVNEFIERLMERPYWAKIITGIKDKLRISSQEQIEEGNTGVQASEAVVNAVLGHDTAEDIAANIAVTESVTALNGGQNEVVQIFQLSGVNQKRQWKTMGDERVRPKHREVDGQVRGMNESFNVGGEEAMYPGDPSLSPGNRINCRCTVVVLVPGQT